MVYQNGPKLVAPLPSRPLTRVMARARSPSAGKRNSSPSSGVGGSTHMQDAYRMEVNEYIVRPGSPTSALVGPAIPCVTVRDMHTFIPDKKQRRVWIPVAVCDELCKVLKQCRQDGEKGSFDVSKLPERVFQCPVTKKVCEIERVEDSTRLRTYMDVTKESSQSGGFVEVIELRNELMSRLVKFLDDVATRYRRINTQMVIPSLYSYSGERRFYYDLRETRWGLRLHISQVTDLHRNVIGIPLEAVVAFRDRLNQAIEFLGLEDKQGDENGRRPKSSSGGGTGRKGPKDAKSGSRRVRNNRRQGRRRNSSKGQSDSPSADKKQEAGSDGDGETVTKRDVAVDENVEKVKEEKAETEEKKAVEAKPTEDTIEVKEEEEKPVSVVA